MSSISNISTVNPYSKINYQGQISRNQHYETSSTQGQSAFKLPSDQISISSEGLEALSTNTSSKEIPDDPLQRLVDEGVITQEQLDAIKTELEANRPEGQRPMGPPPGGKPMGPPPNQAAESTSEESNTLQALLDSLVENGTIDEDQKNALQESLLELSTSLFSGSKPQ